MSLGVAFYGDTVRCEVFPREREGTPGQASFSAATFMELRQTTLRISRSPRDSSNRLLKVSSSRCRMHREQWAGSRFLFRAASSARIVSKTEAFGITQSTYSESLEEEGAMFYRSFPAGYLPASVAERLNTISAKNAEDCSKLMAEFWEAERARDYRRADRLTVQIAPYLELGPTNPVAGISGGVGGRITVNELQFLGS
jgi:hypothetical protein